MSKQPPYHHASCQEIGLHTYEVLGDSEMNVSWHCWICERPNYSSTVHDLHSKEVTFGTSSIGSVPDLSVSSPNPNDYKLKPVHSSTPAKKQQSSQQKLNVPLRVLKLNFHSIKMKQCRLSNIWLRLENKKLETKHSLPKSTYQIFRHT